MTFQTRENAAETLDRFFFTFPYLLYESTRMSFPVFSSDDDEWTYNGAISFNTHGVDGIIEFFAFFRPKINSN